MVGQGTYYKNIDDLLEIGEAEIQLMYVPLYCINHKTRCDLGTGTRAFKDKYVASEHEEVIPEIKLEGNNFQKGSFLCNHSVLITVFLHRKNICLQEPGLPLQTLQK